MSGGTRARVLDVLERYGGVWSIERMAREVGIAPRTFENWIWRLRWRKTEWRGWYTTGAAAKVTGLSPQWLSKQCRAGALHCRRTRKSPRHPGRTWWLICPEDVERISRARRPELWKHWRDSCL